MDALAAFSPAILSAAATSEFRPDGSLTAPAPGSIAFVCDLRFAQQSRWWAVSAARISFCRAFPVLQVRPFIQKQSTADQSLLFPGTIRFWWEPPKLLTPAIPRALLPPPMKSLTCCARSRNYFPRRRSPHHL